MPTIKVELSQKDIRELIAQVYKCEPSDVELQISPAYYGGPTDRSPGEVTAVVSVKGKFQPSTT